MSTLAQCRNLLVQRVVGRAARHPPRGPSMAWAPPVQRFHLSDKDNPPWTSTIRGQKMRPPYNYHWLVGSTPMNHQLNRLSTSLFSCSSQEVASAREWSMPTEFGPSPASQRLSNLNIVKLQLSLLETTLGGQEQKWCHVVWIPATSSDGMIWQGRTKRSVAIQVPR